MGTLQGNQTLQRPFVGVKQAVNTREELLNKKKKKTSPQNDNVVTRHCATYKRQTTKGWAPFGLTIFFFISFSWW